jgi:hypothetical protein
MTPGKNGKRGFDALVVVMEGLSAETMQLLSQLAWRKRKIR